MKELKDQRVFSIVNMIGNSILLVLYGVTLARMQKGTKYEFFMTLIILLMCASLFGIVNEVALYELVKLGIDSENTVWMAVSAVSLTIYNSCFSVAVWLFAFEYFSITRIMPLALKGIQISTKMQKTHKVFKVSVIVIDVTVAMLAGFFMYMSYYYDVLYNKDQNIDY